MKKAEHLYKGWGKSRFTVVSTWNTVFIFVLLLIIVLFSIWTIVNLLLPNPVCVLALGFSKFNLINLFLERGERRKRGRETSIGCLLIRGWTCDPGMCPCNRTQIWLPATTQANTWEAGADIKRKWFIFRCQPPGIWGLMSQSPPPEMTGMGKEWEDSCFKAHFHFSVQAEVFIRKERGTEQRNQGAGCKVLYVQMSTVHSDKPSDGPVCVILD